MTEPDWIAEHSVIWVLPTGEQHPGRIAISLPRNVGEFEDRCTLALDGLEPQRAVSGDGTLQALLLAIRYAGYRLHDFTSRGGRVLESDGSEFGLAAIFGPILTSAGEYRPPG